MIPQSGGGIDIDMNSTKNSEDCWKKKGMRFTGSSDYKKRIEILEIPDHVFYFGIQYHGEFHSRPGKPEPSFEYFIKASIKNRLKKNGS